MKKMKNYLISVKTAAILPEFTEYGTLNSIVIEHNKFIYVTQSPSSIIDFNLRLNGSSMRGARDGVKAILGNISMNPVVINETQGVYWFPSKSYSHLDCIWFALHFQKWYERINERVTKVTLLNDFVINIDVSCRAFENRLQRTYLLKSKKEERLKQMGMLVSGPRINF